ncbi:hypothetical protein [Wenxinia marina]|uniref:Uncharacterized protein n=1 Tax=Wenxinia marina DSM 24838 TaxID=1123501 RepID=A0A0D0Q7P9_9RHOB|nr:hypothetical protein [Wenxinia marina]KIQ70494.1 hypothetical protein Wenmar_00870 [Wenxinia marina DSM 24838]GGL52661.1 hypothetical protein GCM10011392_03810 [Wenxinia marina]
MIRTAFALSLGLGAAALASPLHAQQRVCGPHDRVVERLAAVYGESRQSIGLGSNNAVVEIFASAETGTWTITVTIPGGPTCLVAAGEAYQHLAEDLPNTDPPA